ncbi:MAG: 50S ribosomal protein L3 [Phycisphaeraceae bacterium]|nr:50S ribosomal protein L3 [Phycisphaeraceae bacterium]QYK49466.1 MAG: 50S ribosomal protein L3 [Phycisphaeraceae bacterium]
MAFTLLGKKLGMTRILTPEGVSVPVTVIECGPCVVTQLRTAETDKYTAVQIGFGEIKPRRSTIPMIGHDAKAGTTPKRHHSEFRVDASELANYTVGQVLTVKDLEGTMYVDVAGTSKGKGFAGTMKRHNFKGMCASHGTERKHRAPGSIGSLGSNRGFGGGLKKGKKMSGHMGAERVTVRSLDVVRIVPEQNLLLVKGPIPGHNQSTVSVRTSTRLYRSKAKKVQAAKK